MPDPNLKAAAEEIKGILRKYDIAALMTLQGPKSVEFVREVSPSWSCARLETGPQGIRIRVRAQRADFPSLAAQKECVEATVGMMMGFEHQARRDAEDMQNLISILAGHFQSISNVISEE